MGITRRDFMKWSAAGMAGTLGFSRWSAAEGPKIRVGACDWSMGIEGPKALSVGKAIGLNGVEASAGGEAEKLRIADPAYRQEYKAAMKETGLVVSSTAMGLLNQFPMATDPRAPGWVEQVIEATADLGGKDILIAFFGKGDLRKGKALKQNEVDAAIERIKALAPKAEKAGVVLALENTLSGKDNLMMLDKIQSNAVRIYYDVGNSTYNDYDVPAEIRELKDRICHFHFKDGNHYLGEGEVKMKEIAEAIHAINYAGWVTLETATPTKNAEADFKKNADYLRGVLGIA